MTSAYIADWKVGAERRETFSNATLLIWLSLGYSAAMVAERIIEKTTVNGRVSVCTMEQVADHEVVGLHAVLKTFVSGVEGIDPQVAYVSYTSETASVVGHEQVVSEITRRLLKREAIQEHGVSPAVVDGWL